MVMTEFDFPDDRRECSVNYSGEDKRVNIDRRSNFSDHSYQDEIYENFLARQKDETERHTVNNIYFMAIFILTVFMIYCLVFGLKDIGLIQ